MAHGAKVALDGKQYSHDLIGYEALRWVRENGKKPFMLYLAFTIPHGKMQVPDLGQYADEPWPPVQKTYAGMMSRMDASQVLDLLKELDLERNTLVVFTSDNGPQPQGRKARDDFFDSNSPLRGIRRDMYEGGIRVPFIARWPGKVKAGSTSDQISGFWDFVPTAAELLNVSPRPNIEGISYLPTLLGQPDKQAKHDDLYWEFQERGGNRAVRFGDCKAVRPNVAENDDAPIELYNLARDLGEENNVAAEHPDVVKRAAELLRSNHQPSPMFPLLSGEIQAAGTLQRADD